MSVAARAVPNKMPPLSKGRYCARIAESSADLLAAQRLRYRVFLRCAENEQFNALDARDVDDFDAACTHVLIEETRTGSLVCCYRIMLFDEGVNITKSYAAQYYDLSRLQAYPGRLVEMGRFCIAPEQNDPDILRLAWGAMTRFVDANDIGLLFGCTSFQGTNAERYHDAFALLSAKHLATPPWAPRKKAPDIIHFAKDVGVKPDRKAAMRVMPPLLKTYLMMGGWVSDHAVIDPHLSTLHVFTGVEINEIPEGRKKLLRNLAS